MSISNVHRNHRRPRRDVDTAMSCSLQGCFRQCARAATPFVEEECVAWWGREGWLQFGKRARQRMCAGDLPCNVSVLQKEQGSIRPQVDVDAGLVLQFMHEFWIHVGTGIGET